MIYLKWKLSEGTWGTGPLPAISDQGGEACPSAYKDENGYHIGYLIQTCDLTGLETWDVTEVTESEALAFCQNIWADAIVDEYGYITAVPPAEEVE